VFRRVFTRVASALRSEDAPSLGRRLRSAAPLPPLPPLSPPPPVVDWLIGACVLFEVGSGLVSFTVGTPDGAWLFWLHGIVGVTLVGLLAFKLARVRHRIAGDVPWDRQTPLSILMAVVAVASLGTGLFWVLGGNVPIWGWTTLNLHVGLGLLLLPLLLVHLRARFRTPRRTDLDRRAALKTGALLVSGALAWRASEAADRALGGARRRFTGSKPTGDLYDTETEGGSFPVTSWVADDPDPIDREEWSLTVTGLVSDPLELDDSELGPERSKRATLDCTSGWYTVQQWRGVRVGDLLDAADASAEARYVRFVSVTGYRWSLPIAEARDALLATHVGDRRLTHGHGAPVRLVAPGRRGFQWVKWIERIEVRREGDPAQWLVTLISGFD
jgi:DMSO/TMAO reductase YedYZ molybdopterin-dependent catalytic subunit